MLLSKARSKDLRARRFLARLARQTSSAKANNRNQERRAEERIDLSVGVLVVPLNGESPDMDRAFAAITKDVSAKGIGVIANRPALTPEVLICFSGKSDAKLLRAVVRYHIKLGLGWLQLGVKVTRIVDKREYPQLSRCVAAMLS